MFSITSGFGQQFSPGLGSVIVSAAGKTSRVL